METIESLKQQVEDLKKGWSLDNEAISKKLKLVEQLVASGKYTQNEITAALAEVRAEIENIEPRG